MAYYKTVFQIEVLSTDRYAPLTFDINSVTYDITEGLCSGGEFEIISEEEVTEEEMKALLIAQGSDPSFLNVYIEEEEDYDDEVIYHTPNILL